MKKFDPKKIIRENNIHSTFLNEYGLVSAMEESYILGVNDVFEWLNKRDDSSCDGDFLKNEWKKENETF